MKLFVAHCFVGDCFCLFGFLRCRISVLINTWHFYRHVVRFLHFLFCFGQSHLVTQWNQASDQSSSVNNFHFSNFDTYSYDMAIKLHV